MIRHIGTKSGNKLKLAHPDIAIVCTAAFFIPNGGYDWGVFETKRTLKTQHHYVDIGVSWTLDSWHLEQSDGFAHAADLVPIVDGRLSWDDPSSKIRQRKIDDAFKNIRDNMYEAMERTRIKLDWGFAMWNKDMPHWQTKKRPPKDVG